MMTKFLYKIIAFAIFFFVLDKLFLFWEAKMPELEYDQRLERLIIGNIQQEVLILGSSRGARGILGNTLEGATGYTTYNLSYPGSDILFHQFMLEKCLEKTEAKLIVLVLDDPGAFYDYESINFRYDKLYPLTFYPEIRKDLVKRDKKINYVVDWVVAYRVRETFPSNLKVKEKTANETIGTHGSMPLDFTKTEFKRKTLADAMLYEVERENEEKRTALVEMVQMAKRKKVKLLLVYPPNFYPPTSAFRTRIEALVGTDALIYAYNDSNSVYQDPSYFYDESHLKINGAKVFTEELSKEIKAILN